MAKLVIKSHGAVIQTITLDKPRLTIGRKSDNDIVLDDQSVSGHHAQIVQLQSVFFIEDAGSSNGTFVNGKQTERKQLVDGDQIAIGRHSLLYQDESTQAISPPPKPAFDSDKTVVMTPELQRELLKAPRGKAEEVKVQPVVLKVISGSTDQKQYMLTAPVTTIGSEDHATVKLTGWFAPKRAALLTRQGGGYAITVAQEGRKVLVNGLAIQGSTTLKKGDLIEVAGVTLLYGISND
jgi:hypothetical protein